MAFVFGYLRRDRTPNAHGIVYRTPELSLWPRRPWRLLPPGGRGRLPKPRSSVLRGCSCPPQRMGLRTKGQKDSHQQCRKHSTRPISVPPSRPWVNSGGDEVCQGFYIHLTHAAAVFGAPRTGQGVIKNTILHSLLLCFGPLFGVRTSFTSHSSDCKSAPSLPLWDTPKAER